MPVDRAALARRRAALISAAGAASFDAVSSARELVSELQRRRTMSRYSLPAEPIEALRTQLRGPAWPPVRQAAYLKLVLIELLDDLDARIDAEALPVSIRSLLSREAARIAAGLDDQPDDFYQPNGDLFLKDLAILLLDLLPCGAELVQVRAGVPRSLLVRGGAAQLLRGLWCFGARTFGFQPFLELHMDPRRLDEFTPAGWDRTYLRIADLLVTRPHLKGVFGTAWFYDPAMVDVSPHLTYLRTRREQAGAFGFRYGPTEGATGNALAKSERRRQLHRTGRYTPVNYYVVWPRRALLQWAERFRTTGGDAGGS